MTPAPDRDHGEADPWGAAVPVPEWDPVPELDSAPELDPADVEGIPDRPVGAAGRSDRAGRRRRRSIGLIRAHRFTLLVAVCFVVAALEMLAVRPDDQARSRWPAVAGPRSHHGHILGARRR
ncbi:MAG: hypothetical protein JSS97_06975 [Actinobacteria bacterium]|nr:hypothetical protein [Actinomycetota bacterium]